MNSIKEFYKHIGGIEIRINRMIGMYRADCVCDGKIITTHISKSLDFSVKKACIKLVELQGEDYEEIKEVCKKISGRKKKK